MTSTSVNALPHHITERKGKQRNYLETHLVPRFQGFQPPPQQTFSPQLLWSPLHFGQRFITRMNSLHRQICQSSASMIAWSAVLTLQLHQVEDLPPTQQDSMSLRFLRSLAWLTPWWMSGPKWRGSLPKGKPVICRGNKPPLKPQDSSSETKFEVEKTKYSKSWSSSKSLTSQSNFQLTSAAVSRV